MADTSSEKYESLNFFDNRLDGSQFWRSFLDLQNRQPLLCENLRQNQGSDPEKGDPNSVWSRWATKLIVRGAMYGVEKLSGYSVAPGIAQGLATGAAVDLRSKFAPETTRVAVDATAWGAAQFIKANVGAELTLAGGIYGATYGMAAGESAVGAYLGAGWGMLGALGPEGGAALSVGIGGEIGALIGAGTGAAFPVLIGLGISALGQPVITDMERDPSSYIRAMEAIP
jgi:hypothetical protein